VTEPAAGMRSALGVATATGALAAGVVLAVSLSAERPFAPGELDLLLTARAVAGGRPPSLWLGAVHPDALGTYFGAVLLAPLLFVGLSGAAALKVVAAGHFAVLVGGVAGLAARLAGRAAGVFAGLFVLGAPAMFAAHTKYLATTSEVAALEIALLWLLYEALERRDGRWIPLVLLGGAATGLGVAWSLHALWPALLLPAAWWVLARDRRLGILLWVVPAVAVALPFLHARDPWAVPGPLLSVKSLALTALPSYVDPGDLVELARRVPWALIADDEGGLRFLFLPGVAALLYATGVGLRGLRAPCFPTALAVFVVGAGAPLVVAGDLLGYPAGYRYFLPCIGPAAVLLALVARGHVDRRPVLRFAAAALLLPGLLAPTLADTQELDDASAAYVAAQHRLAFSARPLHTHFLVLTPYVADAELEGWVQGYGLHTARDWVAERPVLDIEFRDAMTMDGYRPPPAVDVRRMRRSADAWLGVADFFTPRLRKAFFAGVGLGVAEDGVREELEVDLLAAVPEGDRGAVERGIEAARAERLYWLGGDAPWQDEAWPAADQVEVEGTFVLAHPLTYTPVGSAGRHEREAIAAP